MVEVGAANAAQATVRRRRILQWCLAPIAIIVIGLGYWYPILGYVVPLVMLAGVVGAIVNGRYVCGTLCPRGSFLDRIVRPASRKGHIPHFLRSMGLRWFLFAALMGLMAFRIFQQPDGVALSEHLGRVFWLMCVVTTGIAIILGVLIHPRMWCSFCPMGTMQRAIGGGKRQLEIDSDLCVECRKCERACPFDLSIVKHKDSGRVSERDCLKCSECVAACPRQALAWPKKPE